MKLAILSVQFRVFNTFTMSLQPSFYLEKLKLWTHLLLTPHPVPLPQPWHPPFASVSVSRILITVKYHP
jgi:hypothetical protein